MAKANHRNKQKVPHQSKGQPTTAEIKAALNGRNSKLSTLGPIAEALDVPLWVLLIPNVPKEFWHDKRQDGLIRTVREYVDGAQGGTIKDRADTRMIELQQDVMEAKGIVSLTVKALAASEHDIEMECALRAAYATLDGLFDDLDPVVFWREAQDVSHA